MQSFQIRVQGILKPARDEQTHIQNPAGSLAHTSTYVVSWGHKSLGSHTSA